MFKNLIKRIFTPEIYEREKFMEKVRKDREEQRKRTDRIRFDAFERELMREKKCNEIVSGLEDGTVRISDNVNWFYIQSLQDYLSPVGDDNLHTVILNERRRRVGYIEVCRFECTNKHYSEWVKCLCESMWHTECVTLEDIHGNSYPMGKMLEMTCSIRY